MLRFKAEVTSMAFDPLATSASVVSICSTFRLVDRAGVDSVPFAQDDPLIDTSWHSLTVAIRRRSVSAQARGLPGVAGRRGRRRRATERRDLVRHGVAPDGEPLGRRQRRRHDIGVVRRPPDAVMSWLTVT